MLLVRLSHPIRYTICEIKDSPPRTRSRSRMVYQFCTMRIFRLVNQFSREEAGTLTFHMDFLVKRWIANADKDIYDRQKTLPILSLAVFAPRIHK